MPDAAHVVGAMLVAVRQDGPVLFGNVFHFLERHLGRLVMNTQTGGYAVFDVRRFDAGFILQALYQPLYAGIAQIGYLG